ncbi:hypothetical protein ACQEU5_12375 [Marinactinospora thermotolerans]|uniref:Histone acetyltransferase Rv0428c-like SH3 domain-containing protein n=1 Tax=Marinactinospora thermotolerans DSM 45154 TaxID=1122192 RepID=A0A1T4SXW9_9ACTN|nr:hypothetical protein SAMN02745673_04081 [Marinactinospora thermotolerans DSM 45154]
MGFVARLSDSVTPQDIGRRVTVRIQLPDGRFRDIVGMLEAWEDGLITVRRHDDTVTEVTADDVVASRVIPPSPPRRRPRTGA